MDELSQPRGGGVGGRCFRLLHMHSQKTTHPVGMSKNTFFTCEHTDTSTKKSSDTSKSTETSQGENH